MMRRRTKEENKRKRENTKGGMDEEGECKEEDRGFFGKGRRGHGDLSLSHCFVAMCDLGLVGDWEME